MQLILGVLLFYSFNVRAEYWEMLYDTRAKTWLTLQDIQARSADEIFVVGEEHAMDETAQDPHTRVHHQNQFRLIEQLKTRNRVDVGMEFIAYPFQAETDRFVAGEMPEADFLKAVEWGGSPFEFYRDQVLASRGSGRTLALNAPRTLTRRVSQVGPSGLTQEERALLPPIWERGSDAYFARFQDATGGHVPAEKLENYFWAHSLWDDTMAWRSLLRDANTVLTIIVGVFHTEFGHGLPARLKRYGAKNVTTVIQVPIEDFSEPMREAAIQPDPEYGDRADLIWVYTL